MSTAVMNPKQTDNLRVFRDMLEKMRPQIESALPSHLTADRMTRVTMTALQVQPQLLECTPLSIGFGVLQASSLGLEIGNNLGHCYLVPFNNAKTGRKDAQFLIGYKGLAELAYRSGAVSYMDMHAVYEGDEFDFEYGIHQRLSHKPTGDEEPAQLTHAWAMATLKDGGRKFVVLPKKAIEKTKNRSRAGKAGPWVTDYAAMATKTAVRRLCKLLPLSIESQIAVRREERVEAGLIHVEPKMLPDGTIGFNEISLEPTRADEAEEQIQEAKPAAKGGKTVSGKKLMVLKGLIDKLQLTDVEVDATLDEAGVKDLGELSEGNADLIIAAWEQRLAAEAKAGV